MKRAVSKQGEVSTNENIRLIVVVMISNVTSGFKRDDFNQL